MAQKNVLLIAGGGTLGSYTSYELLRMGYHVDVIALEDLHSLNRNLRFIQARVSDTLLIDLFAQKHYDAIIDYIHYEDTAAYKSRMELLLNNTDQLIFLSSYRVYADCDHPITEESPQLFDVVKDTYFLEHETYAVPKSINEQSLRNSGHKNWTIVRPLISFSHFRLDLVTQGAPILLERSRKGKKILLPEKSRYLTAGVGWAGNLGKMFANLVGNERALGEAFTLGTGEVRTWDEVAGYYADMLGCEFEWIGTDDYLKYATDNSYMSQCILKYDRLFDRKIDASKMLSVTGLTEADFMNIRDGIVYELKYLSEREELVNRFDNAYAQRISAQMDAYLSL